MFKFVKSFQYIWEDIVAFFNFRDPVANIIYSENNKLFKRHESVLENKAKGTIIHKITRQQALMIAKILKHKFKNSLSPLTLPYLLACINIESAFDPACENSNFEGSNPEKILSGYDIGICQFKLKYLIGKDIKDVWTAKRRALDSEWAISYFIEKMNELIRQVPQINPLLPHLRSNSQFPQLGNVYYVATNAYNFGLEGVKEKLLEPTAHGEGVMQRERDYAWRLKMKSVF